MPEGMLRDRIAAALREAQETGPALRVATLRLMMAALRDRELALATDDRPGRLSDAEARAILRRMVRQREVSIETYEQSAHMDLAEQERAEIAVISEFLPRPLTDAEIETAIRGAIRETGARSIRDLGKVMAALKRDHAGRMDFAAAGNRVKAALG